MIIADICSISYEYDTYKSMKLYFRISIGVKTIYIYIYTYDNIS